MTHNGTSAKLLGCNCYTMQPTVQVLLCWMHTGFSMLPEYVLVLHSTSVLRLLLDRPLAYWMTLMTEC
jgi:hypothetical protein